MLNNTTTYPSFSLQKQPLYRAIRFIILVSGLSSGLFYTSQTSAVTKESLSLEPIAVTAEKREAEILSTPISVSAKTGKELEDANIKDLTELSKQIPNLHVFSWGGRRDTNVFIRGIGPGLFTDPTVGFYVDGVNYNNNGAFDLDLIDIERIEVLRGPQGTLYGGNSLAGIVNIITRQPDDKQRSRVSLSWDDISQRKLTASFNAPLKKDEASLNLSVSAVNGDDYIKNIGSANDIGEQKNLSAKGKLRWKIDKDLEAILGLDYERFRGDSYALGPYKAIKKNPGQVSHDFNGIDNRDSKGVSLTLKHSGDKVDFTSITAWRDWNNLNAGDQDGTTNAKLAFHSRSNEQHTQLTQELRWTSKIPGNLRWLAGLYTHKSDAKNYSKGNSNYTALAKILPKLSQDKKDFYKKAIFEDITDTKHDKSGYAAFGQLDYDLDDHWTITGGLRRDYETRKAKHNATGVESTDLSGVPKGIFNGEKSFKEWLPKVALSYTTDDDALIYGSISKGYRAGGFDAHGRLNSYDSETSTNYELGYKTKLLNNRLELSAATFLIDVKNQQIQQTTKTGIAFIDNAGTSRSKGIELESRFKPAHGWLVSLNGSYTDAKFSNYIYNDPRTGALVKKNYSGNRLPNTSKIGANLSVQNRHAIGNNLTWVSRIDNQYIGAYYFDAANNYKQNAHTLVNLKTGVEAKDWSSYFWVKNALNKYYSKIEYAGGALGNVHTAEAGDPRSIGVTFTIQF